jgi:hypothetical protein
MRKNFRALSVIAISAGLLPVFAASLSGCGSPRPVAYYPPPPPPAWTEIARQGFHDGVEAARRDVAHGVPPDTNHHPRFRKPPVPPPAWEDYRHGFNDGYRQVFEHGGPRPGSY